MKGRNKILKFVENKTGMFVSRVRTRMGTFPVRVHKNFQDKIIAGRSYMCSLTRLENNEGYLAHNIRELEDNPILTVYADVSALGASITTFVGGEEVYPLNVMYERRIDAVTGLLEMSTASYRENLIKSYKVSDQNIEKYLKVTSRKFLSKLTTSGEL